MTGRARTTRDGRGGFMLVEALAALALGALILVALLSLTGLMRRSADRAAWGVQTTEVTNRTIGTVAREIRQAAHVRWAAPPEAAGARPTPKATPTGQNVDPSTAARQAAAAGQARGALQEPDAEAGGEAGASQADVPDRPFAFAGAPDRVMFAVTPYQPTGLRAPVFVVYQIDGAGAVLRAEGPLTPDALGPAGVTLGTPERIDPGPERLKFAFVDRQAGGGETIVDAWTEPLKMPAAVRIDRLDPATGAVRSSLRVPLLIDGEPSCAGKTGQCSRVEAGQSPTGGDAQPKPDGDAGAANGAGGQL